ncbi:UNVERIFIED_CONTAM: hypothetical protein HDU68_010159 [Siphonaria sp. JEL0065]|nr:hypothetical protein HDU68_010159 [Siphonaria sp. JEL0065]
MNYTVLTDADIITVLQANRFFLFLETTVGIVSVIGALSLCYFVTVVEIPARGQQLTLQNIASPSNMLLVGLYLTVAAYAGCQATAYSPNTPATTYHILDKIFVIGPVLAQSLFLTYSWIRSAIVVQIVITNRFFRIFRVLVGIAPLVYLLPMVIQFVPLGSWLNFILLVCITLSAILSVSMDLAFTYFFIRLELQNRKQKMEVPAYYFVISRYGIVVALTGLSTLLTYVASQLAFIKYEADQTNISYWILCCSFAVARDVCLVLIPTILFFMKATLTRPSLLPGQTSAKSKLSTFLSEGGNLASSGKQAGGSKGKLTFLSEGNLATIGSSSPTKSKGPPAVPNISSSRDLI